METARGHIPSVDGIRGLAIAAVMAFHITGLATRGEPWFFTTSPPPALWPVLCGFLGVDVFFVLSGLLVFRSWLSLRDRYAGHPLRAVAAFARRRARRILPPYWVSLAILIPWLVPHWLHTANGLKRILMFVSLQQFMDPHLPHRVNTVTWSLTTEVHFYVLLPLLALLMLRFGWARVLAATLAISVVWRIFVGPTGEAAEWILGRADQFVGGMCISMLLREREEGRESAVMRFLLGPHGGRVLGTAFVALALTEGALRGVAKPAAYSIFMHPLAGLFISGLVARGLVTGGINRFRLPGLVALGRASYSVYLWHWPLIKYAGNRWGTSFPVIAGALAATAVVSAISYRFLERPFVRTPQRR